jgi:hypothetical protein
MPSIKENSPYRLCNLHDKMHKKRESPIMSGYSDSRVELGIAESDNNSSGHKEAA